MWDSIGSGVRDGPGCCRMLGIGCGRTLEVVGCWDGV